MVRAAVSGLLGGAVCALGLSRWSCVQVRRGDPPDVRFKRSLKNHSPHASHLARHGAFLSCVVAARCLAHRCCIPRGGCSAQLNPHAGGGDTPCTSRPRATAARDLAIWHVTYQLARSLAPLLGGPLLYLAALFGNETVGYKALFLVAAVLFWLGSYLVLKIASVR